MTTALVTPVLSVEPAVLAALAAPACLLATISTSNNACGSIKERRRRGGTTTCGSIIERRSYRKIPMPQSHNIGASSPRGPPSPLFDWPILALLLNIKSNSREELKPKKKSWNRNMKSHKKLVFLQEYYEQENEYRLNNKVKF